jgi:hypothetical protein
LIKEKVARNRRYYTHWQILNHIFISSNIKVVANVKKSKRFLSVSTVFNQINFWLMLVIGKYKTFDSENSPSSFCSTFSPI